MSWKVYRCDICGRIVTTLEDGEAPVCCDQPMKLLKAGTTDGAREKHVPVVTVDGNKVKVVVGSVEHPMVAAHYITFIAINTKNGGQIERLAPEQKPEAQFTLEAGDEFVSAIEYCNLHGLWEGK